MIKIQIIKPSLFQNLQQIGKKIKKQDIHIFLQQLSVMIKSGVPLLQSLSIIADSFDHKLLNQLIHQIRHKIENVFSLADSLANYPQYFDELTCSLIHIAEQSGNLDQTLAEITVYQEKQNQLKQKVQKALLYPAIVLCISIVISLVLLLYIVPTFEQLFKSMNAPLPWITQFILDIAYFIQHYGIYIFIFLFISAICFLVFRKRSRKIQLLLHRIYLNIPIFGKINQQAIITRFCRTLTTRHTID